MAEHRPARSQREMTCWAKTISRLRYDLAARDSEMEEACTVIRLQRRNLTVKRETSMTEPSEWTLEKYANFVQGQIQALMLMVAAGSNEPKADFAKRVLPQIEHLLSGSQNPQSNEEYVMGLNFVGDILRRMAGQH